MISTEEVIEHVPVGVTRYEPESKRTYLGFWTLGLCNNFAYVVMLSAAHDILMKKESVKPLSSSDQSSENTSFYKCNDLTTGAVLLADVLPTLLIKMVAPFFLLSVPYHVSVILIVIAQMASFIVVATSTAISVSLLGVVIGSFGAGLGELTFLAFQAHFNPNVISMWSSGTGGAGVFGALSYAFCTDSNLLNMSPRVTLLLMLLVPAILMMSYTCIEKPSYLNWKNPQRHLTTNTPEEEDVHEILLPNSNSMHFQQKLTFNQKLHALKFLLKYMIPLSLVYFFEYYINQALTELIVFPNIFLNYASQYRWYQLLYQIGVFISRSSLSCFKISRPFIVLIAFLQMINAVLLTMETYYLFIPSIFLVFAIVLYEGMLGGLAYVNTFYKIRSETPARTVEFSLAAASVADSFGITVAGFISFPMHAWLCTKHS